MILAVSAFRYSNNNKVNNMSSNIKLFYLQKFYLKKI